MTLPDRQELVLGGGTGLDLGVLGGSGGGAVVKPKAFGRSSLLLDGALVGTLPLPMGVAGMLLDVADCPLCSKRCAQRRTPDSPPVFRFPFSSDDDALPGDVKPGMRLAMKRRRGKFLLIFFSFFFQQQIKNKFFRQIFFLFFFSGSFFIGPSSRSFFFFSTCTCALMRFSFFFSFLFVERVFFLFQKFKLSPRRISWLLLDRDVNYN